MLCGDSWQPWRAAATQVNGNKSSLGTGEHAFSKGRDTQDHTGLGAAGGPLYREDSNGMLGTP